MVHLAMYKSVAFVVLHAVASGLPCYYMLAYLLRNIRNTNSTNTHGIQSRMGEFHLYYHSPPSDINGQYELHRFSMNSPGSQKSTVFFFFPASWVELNPQLIQTFFFFFLISECKAIYFPLEISLATSTSFDTQGSIVQLLISMFFSFQTFCD